MDSTTLLVVLGNLLFVLMCGTVGIRLMVLSRRTRQAPELLLGIGFLCIIVAIPCMGVGGVGSRSVGDLSIPFIVLGTLLLVASTASQVAFTWRAFRPGVGWAFALFVTLAAAQALIGGLLLWSLHVAAPDTPAKSVAHGPLFWLRGPLVLGYMWSSIEAALRHAMVRRRTALGIGDPVVENRLMLWCAVAGISAVNTGVGAWLHWTGRTPTTDPLAAGCLAFGGMIGAALLWLVFMPPSRYIDWVSARARARRVAASA